MKKNKLVLAFITVLLVFGLASCGSKKGEVSFKNYESITVKVIGSDPVAGSTYNEVLTALGAATNYTNFDNTTGSGYLEWISDDYSVTVTFVTFETNSKDQVGLYASVYQTPIGEKTGAWEWVITQLAIFTFHASNLFGLLGNSYLYWLGLLIMTLVIRTLGWPVYAKSNDLTLKMQMAQPEIDRVKEKYAGKTDQASQQRMQMETMDIYKRYKINFFGCLMPLMQMPIFIAMYQVVQRFPLTSTSVFGDGSAVMNTDFLWTNLGNTNWLPNLPLAIIVAVTMFLSQWLMQQRQKHNQKKRYQDPKTQQSQKSMQYVMYFMVIMMGSIALGNAGIAFYWIIGNSYQLFQSYVGHRKSGVRQEQLRKQF